MSDFSVKRSLEATHDPLDIPARAGLCAFMFPGMNRVFFAAEGGRGGGGGGGKENDPDAAKVPSEGAYVQKPVRAWGERRAREIAQAYEALTITVPQIVSTIPSELFGQSELVGVLPNALRDSAHWSLLPRPNDDNRPYLHYFLQASAGDWSYHLRWHTPTPRGAWAEDGPTCSLERRWQHYVESPMYRPHEVLIRNLGACVGGEIQQLTAYLSDRLGPRIGAVSMVGVHGWISMQGYQMLLAEHPRDQAWVRTIRDLAHWCGHPEGVEIPAVAKPKNP